MDKDDSELIQALEPSFEKFEGRSPWLYLDSLGHLTIGIGHLVHKKGASRADLETGVSALFPYGIIQIRTHPDLARNYWSACQAVATGRQKNSPAEAVRNRTLNAAVAKLDDLGLGALRSRIDPVSGLLSPVSDEGATPGVWGYDLPDTDASASNLAVMVEEAGAIEKLPFGWKIPIVYFKCFNSFQLADRAIDQLLEDDIAAKIKEVKGQGTFKDFDKFPVPAQVAVIDLAFQYGAAGLAGKTDFASAVKNAGWGLAAAACPSGVAQAERTKFRVDHLKQAEALAKPSAQKPSATAPKFPGR